MSDVQSRLAEALAGRYTLERELGRGGMSIVYLAYDERLSRKVALKILRPELAATLGPERFLREIKVVAGLTHPHILPLHDSGEAAGMLYYVMPYVEGESLRHRLVREGRLPLEDALEITREVADALEYAHQHDVVHRDIKPENILLQAGQAVVSDFGIARAISEARGRVTGTGVAVGTPEYMSPEQASGGTVDGRTDVYSLGCVLYEMLAGRSPGASSGGAGQAPTISAVRPAIPIEIEAAIEVAMAQRPDERFPRVAEFARALREPGMATVSGARRGRRMRRRWWVGLGLVAGLIAAAWVAVPPLLRAGLDGSLYVVVPFGHRAGAAPSLLTGDHCESLLYRAFERWQDVRLVDDVRVHDLRLQRGVASFTLSDALGLARAFGSGRLVWGEVQQVGDTIIVSAAVHDVAHRGATIREHTVRFVQNARDMDARFTELADSLLLGGVRTIDAATGALGTRVLGAWQAYEAGHAAGAVWDLPVAERGFRRALDLDPAYPQANLWLAQTLMWAGHSADEWRSYAATATAIPGALGPRGSVLARALVSLADRQYPQACAHYRRILARDSLDFAAWFGLGECQARDHLVLRDARSSSGWRFRSSYHAAAEAYRRALNLVPSVHRAFTGVASERLTAIFPLETNVVRDGYGPPPDTTRYGAYPALEGDTLAYTPFPIGQVYGALVVAIPPTRSAAVERNRDVLREITTRWVRAFPANVDAWETHGLVLETMGQLAPAQPPERSALAAIRRARSLAAGSGPAQQIRLATVEVRLLVKLEDFERARALADSVLSAVPQPDATDAGSLAGLAAVTGRAHMTADLLALTAPFDTLTTWDGQLVIAPLQVREYGKALLAYAALGAPADSLRALARQAEQQVNSWFEPVKRERVRNAVFQVPVTLAYPELGGILAPRAATGGNYLLQMQWALARGDTGAVRARFERIRALRASSSRPGDVAIEYTYGEARLLLALGDTSDAADLLDLSLNALPTLGTYLLEQVPQAAGLVKAMTLRADLAERAGDRATARRWGRAVAAIWAGADPELLPTVVRMRELGSDRR